MVVATMRPMKSPIVIGLTGSFGAGCSKIAKRLIERHGFVGCSLSHKLRERLAKERDINLGEELSPKERTILQDFGNELREKDPECLAKDIMDKIIATVNENGVSAFVVDSIRNPSEVRAFRQVFPNFYLMAVYADTSVRWERVKDKFRKDLGRFEASDERDRGEGEPEHGQGVQECVAQADILIDNSIECPTDGELNKHLWPKVEQYVDRIINPGVEIPQLDEVFMALAYNSSRRSSCVKRRVGAAIVRRVAPTVREIREANKVGDHLTTGTSLDQPESYVISTGYNEVPRGAIPCAALGGDKRNYCTKDEKILRAMRKMKYCPNCGTKLAFPEKLKTDFACVCGTKIVKGYSVGRQLDVCPAVHAEEAAILQAAKLGGISLEGTVLYTTTFPCLQCSKKIIQAGIDEVVYVDPYPMRESIELLDKAKVLIRRFEGITAYAYSKLY